MRFIADAMLGSLARRLRLLGFDVIFDPQLGDNEVLRIALEQDRVILTRDTGLTSRPLEHDHLLIRTDPIDEQLDQVVGTFGLPGAGPLTRCSVCNGELLSLDRDAARDRVPEHVLRTASAFLACRGCGRVYWEGSHVRNMGMLRPKKRPTP